MKIRFFIWILTLAIMASCKPSEDRKCFKSIGDVVVENRDLPSFSTVVINDHIDLILMEDVEDYLLLETGSNLLNFIVTEVRSDTLFISDDNKCSFLRELNHKSKVYLHSSGLANVIMQGSGDLSSQNTITRDLNVECEEANGSVNLDLDCDQSWFRITAGIADVKLSGNSEFSYFYYFGNGNVDASQLVNTNTVINWGSTGWLKIFTSNRLTGSIDSFGNVYYSGNPGDINVGLNSTGQLIGQ